MTTTKQPIEVGHVMGEAGTVFIAVLPTMADEVVKPLSKERLNLIKIKREAISWLAAELLAHLDEDEAQLALEAALEIRAERQLA